jgi:hypothetical protein
MLRRFVGRELESECAKIRGYDRFEFARRLGPGAAGRAHPKNKQPKVLHAETILFVK